MDKQTTEVSHRNESGGTVEDRAKRREEMREGELLMKMMMTKIGSRPQFAL